MWRRRKRPDCYVACRLTIGCRGYETGHAFADDRASLRDGPTSLTLVSLDRPLPGRGP